MQGPKTCSAVVVLAAVVATADIAGQKKAVRMSQPFTYDSRGVGDNPVSHVIVLKPKEEGQFISRTLLGALQQMQFSVPKHVLSASTPLAPARWHETDTVPLARDVIARHDQAYPQFRLGADVIYGLQYRVRYEVDTKPRTRSFVIDVTPVIYRRGAASSKWHDIKPDYSSDFFAARLIQQITKDLSAEHTSGAGR